MGNETKEPLQIVSEATADHLSQIASIITTAVRDISQEIGKWANEVAAARSSAEPKKAEEEETN